VRLLDDGTACARPTEGEQLADGIFRMLPTPDYDPENEHWEFPPGTIVRIEKRESANGRYLLAVALAQQ
jgi:hypothetical protein